MMLLWVLVFVGVAGGLKKEEEDSVSVTIKEAVNSEFNQTAQERRSALERRKVCRGELDRALCMEGFFFTATALKEVRSGGKLEVLVSLEESLYPHVAFDVSLRYLGEKDTDAYPDEEEVMNGTILAREQVTLEVNELRRVELKVTDLRWRTAYVVVKALKSGHSKYGRQTYARIKQLSSEMEVFVETEKLEYATGDTVDYRVLVVDGNVDKTPKFAQVILKRLFIRVNETRLPWVEVPESGIVRGNFTLVDLTKVRVRVTSNVTSSDFSAASTAVVISNGDFLPPQWMSARLDGLSDTHFPKPRVTGRVKLTSAEGIPLEGICTVTIEHDYRGDGPRVTWKVAKRSMAVGFSGGKIDVDVSEELEALRKEEDEEIQLQVYVTCSHLPSGSVADTGEIVKVYRSLFRVDLLSMDTFMQGNSSHPQSTVVLQFLVDRRDGGSVEEEEPSKGLHVKLLLSEENLERIRPSATNFSLPIPPNGRVRLEFPFDDDTPPAQWHHAIRMRVGDAVKASHLRWSQYDLKTKIHVTPIDPAQLIRRGDVVRFHVRSCVHYASLNAMLYSANAIYSSQRFSFSPQGGWLEEVIELTIPQNATEGSLTLTVYGSSKNQYIRSGKSASVPVNVIPSNEEQHIRVVDQVDVDMSTIVTFRLEGMLADSVVFLHATKLDLHGGKAEKKREEVEGPFRCHEKGYLDEHEKLPIKFWDGLRDVAEPDDVEISSNFILSQTSFRPLRYLNFIDVGRKTSTEDNGTLIVTKTFDRTTEYGAYAVSGSTFNLKSGRNVFSNSPVLRILPPPVTLSISVPPSVLLGETFEVLGYVKNNLATPLEGHVTLEKNEEGSVEVREELVEINPNSFKILNFKVTPGRVGDLVVSLRSNISSRLTKMKKVSVIAFI